MTMTGRQFAVRASLAVLGIGASALVTGAREQGASPRVVKDIHYA